ncbi:MAG TPA: glycoside hydrolase family 35 protein [Armatimonadota bacterium]|nr:glycoside hydrolase family 35 protein [Armatimonadota bacterium]
MQPVTVVGNDFVQDGLPLQIIAGAMHYFRVVPEYWDDRMCKMRACGLNTLETYVPWNLHEPAPGEFCFEGICDIARYIEVAAKNDLMVIVRPGPYICSEWDLGGLPAWLLADGHMQLRCAYQPYLDAVDRFFDALIPRIAPLQASNGGPVIAVQVENEYGSYGNDKQYLAHLEDGLRSRGIEELLFTSDGPSDWMLEGGTLPHILKVANFGSGPDEAFAKLREHQPDGPLMCGEYWAGWFDHWGEEHHTRSPESAAATLDRMLELGASVSIYMFHGGTNFGFMNGANCTPDEYQPTVGSYDSDAAINEAGDLTDKYRAFKETIAKYVDVPEIDVEDAPPKGACGPVELTESVPLLEALPALSEPIRRPSPVPMEVVGQNYGFILYRTEVRGPREELPLIIQDVRDRAQIFVDGEYTGAIYRNGQQDETKIACGEGTCTLDILVENMGRINYGPQLHDRKGITHGVRLGGQFLYDWTIFPLPLDDLSGVEFGAGAAGDGPTLYRGTFEVAEPLDTFLALPGWQKGVAWINGFNLGRHWDIGPQRTHYVPAPILGKGTNEIIVLELHDREAPVVEFRDEPDLG